MITQGPAFTPLAAQNLDAYREIMTAAGIEDATLQEARQFGVVSEVAERFLGWTSLYGVVPDYSRTLEVPLTSTGALHPHPQISSEWALRSPHESATKKLVNKVLRRTPPHGHHPPTFQVPDTHQPVVDMELWGISSQENGVPPYERTSVWLLGQTLPTPLDPIPKTKLLDNWGGRVSLDPRMTRATSGRRVPLPPAETATALNNRLKSLREHKGPAQLPEMFTAAHIANRAARLAVQHAIDPTHF